jgi:hypothetical protein
MNDTYIVKFVDKSGSACQSRSVKAIVNPNTSLKKLKTRRGADMLDGLMCWIIVYQTKDLRRSYYSWLVGVAILLVIVACSSFVGVRVYGQGTLIYDQSSWTNEPAVPGEVQYIEINQPFGQSFIPSLSGVGFVRLFLSDSVFSGGSGATVNVNLLEDSIIGNPIGTTTTITLPGNYSGYTNLFFPTPVAVTPGTTYYFQLSAPSVDNWTTSIVPRPTHYTNGSAFFNGNSSSLYNLWFREGEVVPEPTPALLFGAGWVLFIFQSVRRSKPQPKI